MLGYVGQSDRYMLLSARRKYSTAVQMVGQCLKSWEFKVLGVVLIPLSDEPWSEHHRWSGPFSPGREGDGRLPAVLSLTSSGFPFLSSVLLGLERNGFVWF